MEDITAVSSRTVPPDPSIADALGAHHELSTALADLVDKDRNPRGTGARR